MEAFIIYGYNLTNREVIGLPKGVPEDWINKNWLIGSDNCDDWYFALQVIGADDAFDLVIFPEDFFGTPTKEDIEQLNERRREFYKFFSSRQLKFFLILKNEEDDYTNAKFRESRSKFKSEFCSPAHKPKNLWENF